MNILKTIVFFLLLTPIVGYGQDESLRIDPISLDKHIAKLSKKLFELGNTEKVTPYKNASFLEKINFQDRLDLVKDEKVVIQVHDPVYPKDEFALIDTVVILKFNIDQVKGLGFCMDSNGLRALIPMRYDYFTYKWRPLFVLNIKDLKLELTLKEFEFINYLIQNLDRDIFPVGMKSLGSKEDYPYYVHYKNTDEAIYKALSIAFKEFQDNNVQSKRPKLFYDSLFNNPVVDFTFEKVDSSRLLDKKPFTYYENMKYRVGRTRVEANSKFLKVEITRVFGEVVKNKGEVKTQVVDLFYLKQEDLSPYLPEWLLYLIEEVDEG